MHHHDFIVGLVLATLTSCTAEPTKTVRDRYEPSFVEAASHAESLLSSLDGPRTNDRMLPDPCKFSRQTMDSLDAVLAKLFPHSGDQAEFNAFDRWPITTSITWMASAGWLKRTSEPRTSIVIKLIEGSATKIVFHAPGVDHLDIERCEAKAIFDAVVHVQTRDGVLDTPARGRFEVRHTGMVARLRMDLQPLGTPGYGERRTLVLSLDIPSALDASEKVQILGAKARYSPGLDGRGMYQGGDEVLASSVDPVP